jgi:hypothetical protein
MTTMNTTDQPRAVACIRFVRAWLVVEFCAHNLFEGWHAYIRESPKRGKRNANGDWGWVKARDIKGDKVARLCAEVGITLKGDWTCDDDGLAEVAKRYPLPGRNRGGFSITIGDYGRIERDCPNA